MKKHVSLVACACFRKIRCLCQIRRHLGQDVAAQLGLALVMSRLDYCNAVVAGLPASTLAPLQRVQNSAARLVLQVKHREHVTPALMQLHWLPIQSRITYKLCIVMHQAHTGLMPAYLTNGLHNCRDTVRRLGLRSSTSDDYILPRFRTIWRVGISICEATRVELSAYWDRRATRSGTVQATAKNTLVPFCILTLTVPMVLFSTFYCYRCLSSL